MSDNPQSNHDWTIHSINIHGVFFERWCQRVVSEAPGWSLDSTNYPVEFPPPNGPIRGKESTLDIRASRRDADLAMVLLIECKKNNPEFVNWIFFRKVCLPRDSFNISQVENTPREPPAVGWETTSSIRGITASRCGRRSRNEGELHVSQRRRQDQDLQQGNPRRRLSSGTGNASNRSGRRIGM